MTTTDDMPSASHQKDGDFYFGAAMGHYHVRGVINAAFSLIKEGVEHSLFASGVMPLDRATRIGPFRIEVTEPLRTICYVVEPNPTPLRETLDRADLFARRG